MALPRLWALACVSMLVPSRVASQQLFKIDDANVYNFTNLNGIQFGPKGWSSVNPINEDLRYNSTYTWTKQAGASLIFFFRGTGIAYYADKGANCGPVGVSINGKPYINVTWPDNEPPHYRQQMWGVNGLTEDDHQIVLSNVGTGNPASSTMGIDYFEVTSGTDGRTDSTSAGPGASVVPSNAVLVDDSSNMISYSDGWEVYSSYDHAAIYLGGTQRTSAIPGAAFTFKFNGTAVWYFCDRYETNAVVSIVLDDAEGETVNTAYSPGVGLTQMLIWRKTGLDDGPHTVTVTHASGADTYANVDFFKYMPSSSSSSKSTPIGAIVGGVVGGVALVASGLLFWRWKRRRAEVTIEPQHEAYVGDAAYSMKEPYIPTISPYTLSPSEAPGFATGMSYQSPGKYASVQNQKMGGHNLVTPANRTSAAYAGYPEIN